MRDLTKEHVKAIIEVREEFRNKAKDPLTSVIDKHEAFDRFMHLLLALNLEDLIEEKRELYRNGKTWVLIDAQGNKVYALNAKAMGMLALGQIEQDSAQKKKPRLRLVA